MSARIEFASVRLPAKLVDDARAEAALMNRSISGQLDHWATLGRTLENMPGFTMDRVRSALNGTFSPEDLSPDERRYFHEAFDDFMATPDQAEVEKMAAIGKQAGAAGYDDAGNLVVVRDQ